MVYIILGNGFEESEAIVPCDLLRRAGAKVALVGIGGYEITGGHGIIVRADRTVEETELTAADMLVLPGGLGGVESIRGCRKVLDAVKTLANSDRYVAAICAAPTILGALGLLDGKEATCYPSMEDGMGDAHCTGKAAVRDGNIITGKGAGTAFEFALLLIETLCGRDAAERVVGSIHF